MSRSGWIKAAVLKILFLNTHSTPPCTLEIDRAFYAPLGVKVHPPFSPAPGVYTGKWQKCRGSFENLINLKAKRELLAAIKDSDLIMSSGGGYIYSYGKYFPRLTFLQHWLHLRLSLAADKPVVFFPQSFGPFANRAVGRMCGSVLREKLSPDGQCAGADR